MTNSAHLEDRKAAAQTLKSLARSHRLEIGTLALQGLIEELRRDLEDAELAKIVLETLDILCSKEASQPGIEVQFCEIFLKDDENVTLLLDLMGESDFYLRFTSIQILLSLSAAQTHQLQSAVLNSSGGSNKILDLLQDSREIVRNEGLLLCEALIRGSADLQKMFTFQGAFELVIQIIVEESGPWKGAAIIQDAFNLIGGLLQLNTSNQIYFRDSICFKQLAGLLALPIDESEEADSSDSLWNRTRISNYLAGLSVLDGLLCKENVNLETSQNSALKTHFMRPLLVLAFDPKIPLQVSGRALKCLGGLIWSNGQAQQDFSREKLAISPLTAGPAIKPPFSPLMGAILLALHGNPTEEASEQRNRALELVEAFCFNNPEGQLVLLSTLKGSQSVDSPGTAILDALFDLDTPRKRDPWHCWYASALLCNLIDGNEDAKRTLFQHQISNEDDGIEDSSDILTELMLNLIRITRDSRGSTCQKSIVGYLQLLVVWLHESPSSIKNFLHEGSYVQYLIERITTQSFSQDTEIQGLCSLILGICVLFNDESITTFGSEALKGIIKNRIGPDLYLNRLARLKAEKSNNSLISERIENILMKNHDNIMHLVARPTPAGTSASQTATLAQTLKDLTECRALLVTTQGQLSHSTTLSETLKRGISERDAYICQLQKLITEKNQKIAQMAHEMSNFEQEQLQQQHQEGANSSFGQINSHSSSDQLALQNLQETIKNFQDTVNKQQARIEELEHLLTLSRNGPDSPISELEKWKDAYHKLYEQVQQQLNFNLSEGDEIVENSHEDEESKKANEPVLNVYAENPIDSSLEASNNFDEAVEAPKCEENNLLGVTSSIPSDSVEILSPSMFMSPLVADDSSLSSGPVVVEDEYENTAESPELKSFNQLPEQVKSFEYPELKEAQDTSFNAAVIVSEDFAHNAPNSSDEILISNECPPENFLASEPDDNQVATKQEIEQVLDFFDNLPQVTRSSSKPLEDTAHEVSNFSDIDFNSLNLNENEHLPHNALPEQFISEQQSSDHVESVAEDQSSVEAFANEQENVDSSLINRQEDSSVTNGPALVNEGVTFNSALNNEASFENSQGNVEASFENIQENVDDNSSLINEHVDYSVDNTNYQAQNQEEYYSNEQAHEGAGYETYQEKETSSYDHYKDYYANYPDSNQQQEESIAVDSQVSQEFNYPIYENSQVAPEYTDSQYYTTEPGVSAESDPQAYDALNSAPQEQQEYYYYDESTGFTYGFDQNMNQYYYYDPNTGEYTYYTAAEAETGEDTQNAIGNDEATNYQQYYTEGTSEASSNPSLFDTAGPPIVPLQAPSTLSGNFVTEQVYNL